MNKQWSELNRKMQAEIKKEATWQEGIGTLASLRNQLTDVLYTLKEELTRVPFAPISFSAKSRLIAIDLILSVL